MKILRENVRKAGKAHRCVWCGQDIRTGDSYVHIDVVDDEGFGHQHWHPECLEGAREEFVGDEFLPYSNERPSDE